jgi:hypothetical protein
MKRNLSVWFTLLAIVFAGCHSEPPPIATPVANGPPGPSAEGPNGPPQTAPPPAPISEDYAVAREVRSALRQEPTVGPAADQIRVKVTKGVVLLRGTLPPGADRDALHARLDKLPGVDRIDDQLVLKTP